MQNIKEFSQDVVLRNGKNVVIRAIRADDKQALLEGFHRLIEKGEVHIKFDIKIT